MIKEIGSEFCGNHIIKGDNIFNAENGSIYFFDSGRSAIRAIVKDIKAEMSNFKVYMPDYYCETMIKPFVEQGIKTEFYKVCFTTDGITFDYDFKNDCQVIFLINYFGFENCRLKDIISKEKSRGKIIIYDATQSVFNPFPEADYVFSSFRKWFFSFSAFLIKKGKFNIALPCEKNEKYISLKSQAALKKSAYLNGKKAEKTDFLNLYTASEEVLDNQTREYLGDANELKKIDFEFIKNKRKKNSSFLIEEIKKLDLKEIVLPFDRIKDNDTPLFVPILVDKNRDELRKSFIKNNIFLPIHWPMSAFHCNIDNSVYKKELSLVCDQRYDFEDMKRILEVLNNSVKEV